MKKIRLTENDLEKIVRRIIKENKFEDYMAYPSEEGLLLKVYELADIMGHGEDSEMPVGDFSDLSEAADYLEDEMYDGNHGSVIEKKIHDLLTNIYEIIGYPDEEEFDGKPASFGCCQGCENRPLPPITEVCDQLLLRGPHTHCEPGRG